MRLVSWLGGEILTNAFMEGSMVIARVLFWERNENSARYDNYQALERTFETAVRNNVGWDGPEAQQPFDNTNNWELRLM
jgi:hypothetical protein